MAAYVELNRPRQMNGRSYSRGALVHVPNCVARAMDRQGVGRRLSNVEAKAKLSALEKEREKKAAKAAKSAAAPK